MESVAQLEHSQSNGNSQRQGPAWLSPLLRKEFFGHCKKHTTGKHEKNQFCLTCCSGPYCPEGLSQSHSGHASVQVRKASHRDVVRITDIHKYLDISNIQAYTINSAKIVFLQSRPQPKLCKGAPKYCDTCHRSLADQVRFCSINCKLVSISHELTGGSATEETLSPPTDARSISGNPTQSGEGSSHLAPSVSNGQDGESAMNCETATSFFPVTPKKQGTKRRSSPSCKLRLVVPSNKRKALEDGAAPLSPMSVLGSGPAFAQDWPDFHDLSTPDSLDDSSTRIHPRKQFHPSRAPFFWLLAAVATHGRLPLELFPQVGPCHFIVHIYKPLVWKECHTFIQLAVETVLVRREITLWHQVDSLAVSCPFCPLEVCWFIMEVCVVRYYSNLDC